MLRRENRRSTQSSDENGGCFLLAADLVLTLLTDITCSSCMTLVVLTFTLLAFVTHTLRHRLPQRPLALARVLTPNGFSARRHPISIDASVVPAAWRSR